MCSEHTGPIRKKKMKTTTENKSVVLITGVLTGIGQATAKAFAHKGAHLVVSSDAAPFITGASLGVDGGLLT